MRYTVTYSRDNIGIIESFDTREEARLRSKYITEVDDHPWKYVLAAGDFHALIDYRLQMLGKTRTWLRSLKSVSDSIFTYVPRRFRNLERALKLDFIEYRKDSWRFYIKK